MSDGLTNGNGTIWHSGEGTLRINGQKYSANSSFTVSSEPLSDDPIANALRELKEHFAFNSFHEDRVRTLLENDESLTDDLNHLIIAASLALSDATEMKGGELRAYEMGDKIIIEEEGDDGWEVVRTIGIKVAQILAHARAQKRVEEIEDLVGGIARSDRQDRIDDLLDPDDGPLDGLDDLPPTDPPSVPIGTGPIWVGDSYTTTTTEWTADDKLDDLVRSACYDPNVKITDLE